MATQLVPLKDVERLSPRVIRILGGNPSKFTLQGTNTYLVGTGPKRILIDTGEGKPTWPPLLASVLESEQCTVTSAILTHWHHDHVGGVPDLRKLCPETKVYKNQPRRDSSSSAAASSEGELECKDGQVFRVEGATVRALHCPGHTTDHVALILEEEGGGDDDEDGGGAGVMFTGDNVLGHGTAVFEDLAAYMTSLHLMLHEYQFPATPGKRRAYPAHGAVIEDAVARIKEYIRHREQREDEIVRVLRTGTLRVAPDEDPGGLPHLGGSSDKWFWTAMELVKLIYWDVPENLHDAAQNGVLLVLRKLEGEGKVRREEEEKEKADGGKKDLVGVRWGLNDLDGKGRAAL